MEQDSGFGPAILVRIAEDLAKTSTKVDHVLDLLETERAERAAAETRHEALEARVEGLERERIRLYAYAGGAVSAGLFLLEWVKDHVHLLVPIIAYLLSSGCAPAPGDEGCCSRRWDFPPAVVIDQAAPSACKVATEEAVLLWEGRGVVFAGVRYAAVTHGLTPNGTIAVTKGPLSPGTAGETQRKVYAADPTSIAAAEITLVECKTAVADHELGHGLGLEHNPNRGYVMYYTTGGYGPKVSQAELDWVR